MLETGPREPNVMTAGMGQVWNLECWLAMILPVLRLYRSSFAFVLHKCCYVTVEMFTRRGQVEHGTHVVGCHVRLTA